jgi:hypothetical protein
MKNVKFHQLLGAPRFADGTPMWTVGRLAAEIESGRSHVNQVLNNVPGRGYQTRRKLVSLFRRNFTYWRDFLITLGWDENGNRLGKDEGRMMNDEGKQGEANGVMSGTGPGSSSE